MSHFLSAFGDRVWQFAVPVLFMTIWSNTLLPGAIYSFVVNLITANVYPKIGNWVDSKSSTAGGLMKTMRTAILGEALAMMGAAGTFLFMLEWLLDDNVSDGSAWEPPPFTWQIGVCYCVILVCSSATEIYMQVGTLSLETKWPMALMPTECPDLKMARAKMVSTMSSLDQLCKLLGPTAFGFVVNFSAGNSPAQRVRNSVAIILGWNLLCVPVEWYTMTSLYSLNSERLKGGTPGKQGGSADGKKGASKVSKKDFAQSDFLRHPLFLPSFAGTIISFTVLNASPLSTAWLVWAGIPLTALGFLRGLAAASGVVGSSTYSCVYICTGNSAERTAMIGIWMFFLCVLPCALAMMVIGPTPTGAWALLVGMTISRFALLWFKPAAEQLTQERVVKDEAAGFKGIKKQWNYLFTVGVGALAIYFHEPNQFDVLVYMSVAAVGLGAFAYSAWFLSPTRDQLTQAQDQ